MDEERAIVLVEHIGYQQAAVVSKTLIKKETGTVTLFAFDTGQELSEHATPYDALAHILDGQAEWRVGGELIDATAGMLVMLPANVPHAVVARQPFKMLLTMIRA
jgi:quercetin dioxygenase-like cupin family protein